MAASRPKAIQWSNGANRLREGAAEQPADQWHDGLRETEGAGDEEGAAHDVGAQLQTFSEGHGERIGGDADGQDEKRPGRHGSSSKRDDGMAGDRPGRRRTEIGRSRACQSPALENDEKP
ncbi:hypothetical protein QE367_001969 [Microbacterium paludicola]|uniref:Uncharacterized protein n=1 Tax=Microbacterium paludicola TaxID=300019 RepID=A0ABU1I1L1_9MICO|nr:hypothetical protein [Microbacterium paludicola]